METRGKSGASLRKQARVCALCGRSLLRGAKHLRGALFELKLTLSRLSWERGKKCDASIKKQVRVRTMCGVMQ